MRLRKFIIAVFCLVAVGGQRASAVGWDRDDFIITGSPNFPQYIGIFDHDLAFKGYLETSFLGVQGMDFDAQGNLVAIASLSTSPEVRVYSPTGTRVGGFTVNDPALQYTGDIKVAPNGNFALGSYTSGVRVYTPQGSFVRQYGAGDSRGITYVPGNRLWAGGDGTTVKIFDTVSGAQVGTFSANGQTQSYSMQYSAMTDSVLIVDADRDAGGVYERDLGGALLHQFHLPMAQTNCLGATRGHGGDVFGTADISTQNIVHWQADGSVVETLHVFPSGVIPVRILWAGVVPEPGPAALLTAAALALFGTRLGFSHITRVPKL